MDEKFTTAASLIAAVAAIIAPLLTTIIQSIRDYRLKKLELVYSKKLQAIKDFTDAYDAMGKEKNHLVAAPAMSNASLLATLCKNEDAKDALIDLSEALNNDPGKSEENNKLYIRCVKLVNEEMIKSKFRVWLK